MSDPIWMQPPHLRFDRKPGTKDEHDRQDQPHLSWPHNPTVTEEIPLELDGILRQNRGSGCQIVRYSFVDCQWQFDRATKSPDDVKDMVITTALSSPQPKVVGAFFLVSSLQDEAMRSLGYWMCVPPRFFALPPLPSRVITGTKGRKYLAFSLQYMGNFPVGHKSPNYLPHCRFRDKAGYQPHEWHASHARCFFFADPIGTSEIKRQMLEVGPTPTQSHGSSHGVGRWRGIYMFDEGDDDPIATKLTDRLVSLDRADPDAAEVYQGLGQIIRDVIFIISDLQTRFFDAAMQHLQVLSDKCLDEDLDPAKQLEYTRELYELSPVWSQVRRQLNGTKSLLAQVSRHEISSFTPGVRDNRYYVKRLSSVDDQLSRCEDAVDKTKNLISLIMSVASLQESRAAVRESRAANNLASSIQRITVLTFIYLPLTLASSILGMNISQVTGEATHSRLWVYFVIAVLLMAATFGGWLIWARLLSDVKQRVERRAARRADAAKGA